jgi:hypothetical protein
VTWSVQVIAVPNGSDPSRWPDEHHLPAADRCGPRGGRARRFRDSVLKGTVTLDYRTTERVVVLNLPGRAQRQFKLRLPASPSHSDAFGPWHLADGIVPATGDTVPSEAHDAFAIRYRVL